MEPSTEKFVFIQGFQAGQSQRTKELLSSNARSHAAAISHQRSRAKTKASVEATVARQTTRAGDLLDRSSRAKFRADAPAQTLRQISRLSSPDEDEEIRPAPFWVPHLDRSHLISPPDSPEAVTALDDDELALVEQRTPPPPEPDETPKFWVVKGHVNQAVHNLLKEPSPQTWRPKLFDSFSGLRIDPFYCIPGSTDGRVASTLDFYAQILGPNGAAACYVFDVIDLYAWFLEMLSTSQFYDAGMGVVQALHENIRKPGSPVSSHVLTHRGKAMASVRNHILRRKSKVDNATILAMIFLALLEGGMCDVAAYELHKKNIKTVVACQGGLKSIPDGSILKGALLQYDTVWALESGTTMFPGERREHEPMFPVHPFATTLSQMISGFPSGFKALALEGALSMDVFPVIQRAAFLNQLSPQARRDLFATSRRARRKYDDFAEACPALGVSGLQGSIMEKMLCTAILCFAYIALDSRSMVSGLRASRSEMSSKLHLFNPKTPAEADCLTWIYLIGIDAWTIGCHLRPEGCVMLKALRKRLVQDTSLEAIAAIAKKFLWTSILESHLRIYWNIETEED